MDDDDENVSNSYAEWDADRQARFDHARARLATALNECIQIAREDRFPDDPPFVQGWIAIAEWTNVAAERENWGGRDLVTPHGQMLSIGAGLAGWAETRHL